MVAPTHNMNDGREDRVARYKEERRRQLAAQFGSRDSPPPSSPPAHRQPSSSGGGGSNNLVIRSTRASRLRSAAVSESVRTNNRGGPESIKSDEDPIKKEKILKRRTSSLLSNNISNNSNNNRPSSTSSTSSSGDQHHQVNQHQSSISPAINVTSTSYRPSSSPKSDRKRRENNDLNCAEGGISAPSHHSWVSSSTATSVPRSSQLVKRQLAATSRKNSDSGGGSTPENIGSPRVLKKTFSSHSSPNHKPQIQRVKSTDGGIVSSSLPASPLKQHHPHSILKKSSLDETHNHPVVSILKRKTSQEEGVSQGRSGSPLRFSPSVVERRGRGILKKHRSLDDSRYSPDLQNGSEEHKPILKTTNQRRCSLEEGATVRSGGVGENDVHYHQGILKRKTSREERGSSGVSSVSLLGLEDNGEYHHHQQGILKRKGSSPIQIEAAESLFRSVAQSLANPDTHHHHQSLPVKPILKKKDEEDPTPKPILKKKSSSEEEEHPVKPILKPPRQEDQIGIGESIRHFEVKPILKQNESGGVIDSAVGAVAVGRRSVNTGSGSSVRASMDASLLLRRPKSPLALDLGRRRPLSVAERIFNLEIHRSLDSTVSSNDQEEMIKKMEGEDDDEEGQSFQRRGSVSEKASLWAKMEKEKYKKESTSDQSKGRSRSKTDIGRFITQPITLIEVELAKKKNKNNNLDSVTEGESQESPVSVSERVRQFSIGALSKEVSGAGNGREKGGRDNEGEEVGTGKEKHGKEGSRALASSYSVGRLPPRPPISATRLLSSSNSSSIVAGLLRNVEDKNISVGRKVEWSRERQSSSSSHDSSSGEESSDEAQEVREITRIAARKEVMMKRTISTEIKEMTVRRERGSEEEDEEETSSGGREIKVILSNGKTRKEVVERNMERGEVSALRRCATQPMPGCQVGDEETDAAPLTIAQRLAALQKSGHSEWKKRITRLKPEDEGISPTISKGRVLAERVVKLETASQGWKSRVAPSDSAKFSVAGRMTPSPTPGMPGTTKTPVPNLGGSTRTPAPLIFHAPNPLLRSSTMPTREAMLAVNGHEEILGPIVKVPNICDEETLTSFFSTPLILPQVSSDIKDIDFEELSTSHSQLLVTRKSVRVQRKHRSINPIKALAQRSDLKSEYIEVRSANLERERKRANIERMSKSTGLAVEALAGLASEEDIKSISLRKTGESPRPWSITQWPHPLLLRIKGRRRPITSVVKPHYTSINQGDTFILITQSQVFHWIGELSNVIERSIGKETAQEVQSKKDLGCVDATNVITLQGQIHSDAHKQFWQLLSLPKELLEVYTGEPVSQHPDEEDMVFETAIAETYMVYSLCNDELVPVQSAWGKPPKFELLDSSKVLVFDFGSEVYLWSGKNVEQSERKLGSHLAKELHKKRHSNWHPTGITWLDAEMETNVRPEWSVVCKVTQHMEPILFKEKFSDWPSADISSVSYNKQVDISRLEVSPGTVEEMVKSSLPAPDLILEGTHLGRGKAHYDEESRRHFEVSTLGLKCWRVEKELVGEYGLKKVAEGGEGQLMRGESYILKWSYRVSASGRGLSGEPSKHGIVVGREREATFVWHGSKAPTLEQGAAALLSIADGDSSGGKQVIEEGGEPPALIMALTSTTGGCPLVIHDGRHQGGNEDYSPLLGVSRLRLFACSGEVEGESKLIEIPAEPSSLRSKASFWHLDPIQGHSYLWHGCHASEQLRKVALNGVNHLIEKRPPELRVPDGISITVEEIREGNEPFDFLLGVINRDEYDSHLRRRNEGGENERTMRIFRLSPYQGELKAMLVPSQSYHPDYVTPYPYRQKDLYSIIQPGLALVEEGGRGEKVWLWDGRGRDGESGSSMGLEESFNSLALQYASSLGIPSSGIHHVWAGLEPKAFTNLFLLWHFDEQAAQYNINEGHYDGEMGNIEDTNCP